MKRLLLFNLLFLITLGSCHGQCLNASTSFNTNLRTLLDLLTKNTPLRNGFYETSVGDKSDKVYGVGQCKAKISSLDCANCLKSHAELTDGCQESSGLSTLFNFCTLKISNDNFFGVWDNFSSASFNDGLDNPLAFSKGYSMMEGLATTVPDQPLMYQSTYLDLGDDGKRYGLSQCSRDLSKLNCQNCLEDRLVNYRSFVENRTEWEILGISCSMWYSNASDAYSPEVTALTPSQSQVPIGPPTLTSGAYNGGSGICSSISITIRIITFTIQLAITGFKFTG